MVIGEETEDRYVFGGMCCQGDCVVGISIGLGSWSWTETRGKVRDGARVRRVRVFDGDW